MVVEEGRGEGRRLSSKADQYMRIITYTRIVVSPTRTYIWCAVESKPVPEKIGVLNDHARPILLCEQVTRFRTHCRTQLAHNCYDMVVCLPVRAQLYSYSGSTLVVDGIPLNIVRWATATATGRYANHHSCLCAWTSTCLEEDVLKDGLCLMRQGKGYKDLSTT